MSFETLALEIIIILVLVLINGFFSGAEIAIVSAKRSILDGLAKEGSKAAAKVSELKKDPTRLLATVQIGVTVVGTLASVIGGVAAIEFLKPLFMTIPLSWLRSGAEMLAVGAMVVIISYAMLVAGELAPKTLAMKHPERIACMSAVPIDYLSRIAGAFIKPLSASTDLVLKLFGVKGIKEERVFISEEELRFFITEGKEKGIFEETEASLLHGIFEFADTTVKEVMVAKPYFNAIEISTPPEEILKFIVRTGFSRYPVYEGNVERIAGILFNKDLFRAIEEKTPIVLRDLLRPAYFVPDSIMISRLLREMQRRKVHMAIVIDEHGTVDGLVTIEDILEEIVGEIEDEYDIEKGGLIEKLKDGAMIIDASASLRDLEDSELPLEETDEYNTLAGFMLSRLQRLPKGGEFIAYKGFRFTVVDVDGMRIVKVKAERLEPQAAKSA
ncbi:MAG: HlyC/CorC family transporter [Deltaproteobacteria bacterium]|nr:HlyC/CorC family transporter [Deltaproteobacteria bacterium]